MGKLNKYNKEAVIAKQEKINKNNTANANNADQLKDQQNKTKKKNVYTKNNNNIDEPTSSKHIVSLGEQRPFVQTSNVEKIPTTIGIERGTKGQPFDLETNYLKLDLTKMPDIAYHYNVKIKPDRPKKFMRPVFEAYIRKIFPKHNLAYDGSASAYSPVLIQSDKLGTEILIDIDEKGRKIPFKVIMKPTDDMEIDLKSLKT